LLAEHPAGERKTIFNPLELVRETQRLFLIEMLGFAEKVITVI